MASETAAATVAAADDRTATGHAVDSIRTLIFDGQLAPGQRLIEAELRDLIPVGRSTLREAFRKLEAEGLVEINHQRGARVRRLTRAAVAELFELRECLEGFAARLAAGRADDRTARQWLGEAREVWVRGEALDNALVHMENNVPLHDTIVAMSGNRHLARVLQPLQMPGYQLQFLRLLDAEARAASAREHVEIIDAILAGEAARAEKLMRTHVRRTGRLALEIPGLAED